MIRIINVAFKFFLFLLTILIVSWGIFFYVNKSNNIYIGLGGVIFKNDTLNLTLKVAELNKFSQGAGLESVQFYLWDRRLDGIDVFLVSPSGMQVELASANGRGTAYYRNTTLTDHADSLVFTASTPFDKTYKPNQFLGWLNRNGAVKGKWKLRVINRFPAHRVGAVLYWKLKFSDTPSKTESIEKSPLPLLVVESNQKYINDKKRIKASLYIINNKNSGYSYLKDTAVSPRTDIKIEVRGFSSVRLPKKNYSLRTIKSDKSNNELALLGLPADCEWILNANCMDRSLSRNTLMYELYRQIGYYASRSRVVELMINGQYMGVYILNEKIKRSSERLADTDSFPKGMIIKLDTPRDNKPGWYSKHKGFDGAGYRCYFQYNYPPYDELDTGKILFIQKKINYFEESIANTNDIDSLNKVINVKSFVDFLLLQEFSKNSDAFNLSIYLHLNRQQQVEIGPIWDFDRALGNGVSDRVRFTSGFKYAYADKDAMHPVPMWWKQLLSKPQFKKLVQERWKDLRLAVLSEHNIYSQLDSITSLIRPVQERNFKVWPVLGIARSNFHGDPAVNTYEKEIADMKNWMHERLLWLDKAFSAL